MLPWGAVTFLSPWILAALSAVPVLWWLLRVMPPRPRTMSFPAFFILKDLKSDVKTSAHTPWWLLLLRTLLVVVLILAFAEPVEKISTALPGSGNVVLVVVDNGWPAAANWKARQDRMREFLPRVHRSGRSVVFVTTAPSRHDARIQAQGPVNAVEAEKAIDLLAPEAWPADHAATLGKAREVFARGGVGHTVFFSDGTKQPGTASLLEALQREGGGLTIVADSKTNDPHILTLEGAGTDGFVVRIRRMMVRLQDRKMQLVAYSAETGGILDKVNFNFEAGQVWTDVEWPMLPDLRGQVGRIALSYPVMASALHLTNSRWRQRPVGIVADAQAREDKSFLNEVYYLRRALEDGGTVKMDTPEALAASDMSVIIWPDSAQVSPAGQEALADWVKGGGFLIRFAGPVLAGHPNSVLLPVTLRYGQRSLEGAMTWEKPVHLGSIPEESPFFGLSVPEDVTVTRQLLAEPTPESFEKTWLQLQDGTPLITGAAHDNGFIVLVHTTAGPEWSDFCYSGLYVEALQRMIAQSKGIAHYKASGVLSPLRVMNGFGVLSVPGDKDIVSPVNPAEKFVPSPKTPPGLYGDAQQFVAYNLGDYTDIPQKLESIPASVIEESYALSGEKSMKAPLMKIAVLLLLLDTLGTFWLRGLISVPMRAAAVFAALIVVAPPALAADEAQELAGGIYLAYVETGDQDTDITSYNGLAGLETTLKMRTTIDVRGVRAVNPARDELSWYPVLYWPMTEAQHDLSSRAARNLQDYMQAGGLILFDTRDQQFSSSGNDAQATPGTRVLRKLTKGLQIPELMRVEQGHILSKSFYLLDAFPGRFAGGAVWAEKSPDLAHDGVTSVLIGGHDWAAAWSQNTRDRARFAVEPGGERQREMAYRFGVNLYMMALTGNYKSDQVHVPHILERMKK